MTSWPTQLQQQLISLHICLTGLFLNSYKGKLENVSICGGLQGIICPSKSPYASQLVIVRKKTGEIWPSVDYCKLNSIVVRDAFPLPQINEALQVVNNCQWFTSFDLVQGYLQMPVAESDIHKMAFRAGSSGLYEFTHMPFRLSNSGLSFCHVMAMCLGDQQFVHVCYT